ncbi:ABC transporter substrate-binding protein [Microbacterium sp. NEAU-LLC]|uniref:ABC transporter substrate-binding protein n=1 Tax=Microbacterium helvum TaxID=2773713 RepID=A0ABR8NJT6_9MICO|nr:ABC transporter substrate-binding protein [Microbacterium helvum]MBD3940924.1 ABC transporter substrate-binding protein [Microbacterium helvum]
MNVQTQGRRRPRTAIAAAVTASALALAVGLSGCSGPAAASAGAAEEVDVLRYQGWSNQVSLPELAEDLGYLGDVKLEWVGNTISGPQDIQSAATGQTEFGGAFAGAVVKLIEAGAPVTAVINYYGEDEQAFNGFYVVDGSPIESAKDLIGKKVGVNTLGAHSEAVLDTWLADEGLSDDEIAQVQLIVVPPNDTEEALRRGQIDVGVLGGVLQDRAIANGGLHTLLTDYDLFGAFAGGQYVFRDDFIAKNPETVHTFTTAIAKAIEWERETPKDEVIARFTKIIEGRDRDESTANLQYWKSPGVPGVGGISDEDFTRWEDWLVGSGIVDGKLTPSDYYTNEYNDLAED